VEPRIAAEGRNCWRRPHARRVAFLVDGADYFAAFAAAAESAERSILILFSLDRIWVQPRVGLTALRARATPLTRVASDHLPVRGTIAWALGAT
jgi:endonuclease/exonuclease/phosphatase family metal-dependent hydrolase